MVDYSFLLDELKRILKEKQLKFTQQREVILRVLYENEGHFSPEEIHRMIRDDNPDMKVGIATVYRTLTLLEDEGLADSISFGKEGKKYEIGLKKHHDHLICVHCGKIIEFYDDTIEEQQHKVAQEHKFTMLDHTMKIIGLCNECQMEKDAGDKKDKDKTEML